MGATRLPKEALEDFGASILQAAGLEDAEARVVASHLVEANLRGIDGHGVVRLAQYVDSLRSNGINGCPDVTIAHGGGATAVVDADGGYGFRPAQIAIDLASDLAEINGIGCVGVANSHHFGIAACFACRAADRGLVGIALSNTTAVMPAPGGRIPVVGNSPLAIAIPRDGADPILVDLALSQVSWGKVSLAASREELIPDEWALDRSGTPTTDPNEAILANLLLPIGGYKGFALAVVLELLAGGLTNSPVGRGADTHGTRAGGCGHLFVAIDPGRLAGNEAFSQRIGEMIAGFTAVAPLGVAAPRLPGSKGWSVRGDRLREGIPLEEGTVATLNDLARSLGIRPLRPN